MQVSECVSVCERESECMCVCARARERDRERVSVYVCEREWVWERERECVRGRAWTCVDVRVCERDGGNGMKVLLSLLQPFSWHIRAHGEKRIPWKSCYVGWNKEKVQTKAKRPFTETNQKVSIWKAFCIRKPSKINTTKNKLKSPIETKNKVLNKISSLPSEICLQINVISFCRYIFLSTNKENAKWLQI